MEDLNKTQLILLTLLVSFVTSIATGIITTSLLAEAPPGVTQTINRVVEKTIERVVETERGGEKVREVTVVVKEEDLVIDAISKNSKSIVRIRDNALVDGVSPFYGVGFLVSKEGLVVSARRDILNTNSTYTATFPNSSTWSMRVARSDDANSLVFFQIVKDPKATLSANPVVLGTSDPKLGQTVISIEGAEKDVVSIGRVASYIVPDPAKPSDEQVPIRIITDIPSKTQIVGGPLLNLNGEVVGVRISAAEGAFESFVSLSVLKSTIGN